MNDNVDTNKNDNLITETNNLQDNVQVNQTNEMQNNNTTINTGMYNQYTNSQGYANQMYGASNNLQTNNQYVNIKTYPNKTNELQNNNQQMNTGMYNQNTNSQGYTNQMYGTNNNLQTNNQYVNIKTYPNQTSGLQNNNQQMNNGVYNQYTNGQVYQNQMYGSQNNYSQMNNGTYNQYTNGQVYQNQMYGYPQMNNGMYNQYTNYHAYGNESNKKSRLWILLIVIALIVCIIVGIFFGTSKKENSNGKPHRKTDFERTIMIYMVGSNLETELGAATNDLDSFDYEALEKQGTKVIVIAGGTKSWKNTYIDVNSTSIYELTSSGFQIVEKQDKKNMGESETLKHLLDYGYNNYKSEKYDLIFWNHGGAILGAEQDDFYNDMVNLSEMSNALSRSNFSKDNKMEIVIFRTCLMGTLEVANVFKDYAQYFSASEEVAWLSALKINVFGAYNNVSKKDNGKAIGEKFIVAEKEYIQSIREYARSNKYEYTFSLIDLSKLDAVNESINDLFSSIDLNQYYNEISRIRANSFQYGHGTLEYDMIDIYTFVNSISSISNDKSKKVLDALNKAIVKNETSISGSKGLSFYFPYNGHKSIKGDFVNYTLSLYNVPNLNSYKTFITDYYKKMISGNGILNMSANKVSFLRNNNSSDFKLELTDEQVSKFAKAKYIVFKKNKDNTFLPVYNGPATLNGNILSANFKDRQLKVINKKNNGEVTLTLSQNEETDEYIEYITYGALYDFSSKDIKDYKIEAAQVVLTLDKKTNKISISRISVNGQKEDKNVVSGSSVIPYNAIVDLKDYTHLVFGSSSYKILDSNGNYSNNWESNKIFKGEEIEIKNIKFDLQDYNDKSEYYAVFAISDVNNNTSYSKLIKMK